MFYYSVYSIDYMYSKNNKREILFLSSVSLED